MNELLCPTCKIAPAEMFKGFATRCDRCRKNAKPGEHLIVVSDDLILRNVRPDLRVGLETYLREERRRA